MMSPRVVLVGPPGSGKTTVGEILGKRLGVDTRDTDADVEARAGMAIADIFVEHGEPHFRALEREAIQRALAEHEGVLTLGGGAVLDPRTREDLASRVVVYLEVGLAEAAKRVGLDTSRPLLLGNVRGQLKSLLEARQPLYEQVASITVNTNDHAPEQVADQVFAALEAGTGNGGSAGDE